MKKLIIEFEVDNNNEIKLSVGNVGFNPLEQLGLIDVLRQNVSSQLKHKDHVEDAQVIKPLLLTEKTPIVEG